jgi:arylsulfatase A-like enzyme
LAPRPYTVLIFAALFCTLAVKLFHALRCDSVGEYPTWILADISALLTIDLILSVVCYRWPHKWVIRTATIISAIVCTWAGINAGWLIRTGTQILPTELLPLIRDPINITALVAVNMLRMPKTSSILLIPGGLAVIFMLCVLLKPVPPKYRPNMLGAKVVLSLIVIALATTAYAATVTRPSTQATSAGLRFNCHTRAVMMFIKPEFRHLAKSDFINPKRQLPACDDVKSLLKPQHVTHNIVIVVLEGIQYNYTSLAPGRYALPAAQSDPTPFLSSLAQQGVNFTNARSSITHTTKALFALLTGLIPSASQDIAETIPAAKPYASIATILQTQMGFRTAFFQSAKGTFESRPGLVYNLGFDKFWAREDLSDPNSFVGYLGSDEFAMLQPISEWIQANKRPFLLVVLCSVTHDPYEVPQWAHDGSKDPVNKYQQAVAYTDSFLAALDVELAGLNLADKTIFCVVGDHGEAFGEHGALGHERIAFDEVLRIPFCLRAPFLVWPETNVNEPVSSIDLTPTLLTLLGFDTSTAHFDGANALSLMPPERRVYFAGWMEQGPAGYVQGRNKFVHDPTDNTAWLYDVSSDPTESARINLDQQLSARVTEEIITWRKSTVFRLDQSQNGHKVLFDTWLCKWTGRTSIVKRCGLRLTAGIRN